MTTVEKVPAELLVDFDVYEAALAHPVDRMQEKIAELAAKGPIVYSTAHGGHWIVTHYQEIYDILTDAETFSSYPNNLVTPADFGRFIPLELDPPDHTSYRHALQPLFSPQRMKKLADDIRVQVNELIDAFAPKGEAEFVSAFAHELPARVFLSLMDWPLSDAPMFTEVTDTILFGKPGGTKEESDQAMMMAAMTVAGYFNNVIAERRANPGEDATSALIHTEVELSDGTRLLNDEELFRMFFLLLMGGLHTVQGSLAWTIAHLSKNPEQRAALIADPELTPKAVEEILRIEAAVIPGRRATRDVEIGGVRIAKDDQLILTLCSANRDAEQFTDPGVLDINRSPNRHLSFGAGVHRCLGSHLGRIELKIALEELHRRIPDYALVDSDPPVFHSTQVRGCARMPITFTPEK
ncbi:cytochrome P450 [Mycolicibacterium vanbaalenii]|jgi:cytochrome P450|uniref:cytochrome P450 n=2 Tax=Mycobacteriaceae TaxID=1762 RepID=UPI001CA3532C|nr:MULTISPECIES: cytochrome P450 [Mycolicibacterium]MDW5610702.1 cytochrome P450 [Mycolicibacterium sp. D5.8-2]QZT58767.1 cytochrome P450 [Mycolicibacterium austroafricanum]UJL26538.1 cytochrome P450 [Mycolicibacterium vanbaalenii]WND58634.1 cytochrome P450 [Mycolicibacterium vanbaalenii]